MNLFVKGIINPIKQFTIIKKLLWKYDRVIQVLDGNEA